LAPVISRTPRSIADGQPYAVPATIDEPAILDEIKQALERCGYGSDVHDSFDPS
jgi:propionyl-CoA synthetase